MPRIPSEEAVNSKALTTARRRVKSFLTA